MAKKYSFPHKGMAAALILGVSGAVWTAPARAAEKAPPSEIVLFPFDDHAIPFNKGLLLTLVPGAKSPKQDPRHPGKPVLGLGPKGSPDARRVYFPGTVIKVGDEYRMWYSGYDREAKRRLCYAISQDGLNWEKPSVGLINYKGNTDNNLLSLDGKPIRASIFLVFHDPEDSDPARRFKMAREMDPNNSVKVAFSADGLRWTSAANDKFVIRGEPSGLVKRDGLFYLNAHAGAIRHPVKGASKRTMQTFVSADFENWTEAAHMSFRRDNVPPRPITNFEFNQGEQVHLGASIWDRGNVYLGFYGQYHNETNDRRNSVVDIGLIVSPDALHFKEPIPDFKIIPSFEEPDRAEPRLVQGQAFENTDTLSLVYYGIWTEVNRDGPTGIRVAVWRKDRFGYFRVAPDNTGAHCISSALEAPRKNAKVYLNASGLSPESQLQVEILDEKFRPLPGYTANDCNPIKVKTGLRIPISWGDKNHLGSQKAPIRIRVNFTGRDTENTRLFAIYLQ